MKKMKKARNILFVCLILMAAGMLQGQNAHAEKVGKYDLSDTGLNTKYDVTGDGKPDTVEFKKMNYDGDRYIYTGFEVLINGKTVLKDDNPFEYLNCDFYLTPVFIQTKQHGYFLIRFEGVDALGSEMIYEYTNGKLIKRIDLDKVLGKIFDYYNATVSSVKSDSIKFKVTGRTYMLSITNTSLTYKVGTKGQLSLAKEIVNISYDNQRYRMKDGKTYKSKYLIATTNIPVYHKATGTKKAFTIKKGTKLKITKVSMKGKCRYYCITKSGKKGWIKNRHDFGYFQDLMMYN